jgi:DNA-binding IclR family transcriptional regulator
MKTKLIAATVVALAAMSGVSAFAEGDYTSKPIDLTTNTTRAQVQAEYLQARKEGTLVQVGETGEYAAAMKAPVQSTVSRAEVRAQAIQWAKSRHADIDYGSN